MKENVNKVYNKVNRVERQVFIRALGYIGAAFGLVAALAWNEAIKELIDQYFIAEGNLASKFIYALIVTTIAVIVAMNISRMEGEK
jgi:branched-subunit amino acid permease